MAGAELFGDRELKYIRDIFERSQPAILYRYHPKAWAAALFETRIAEHFGLNHAHAVSSGTAAIETALHAAGVGPGDEVITTAFTFLAPIEAILKLGARPVCVEIDETLNFDPDAVAAAVTGRTKAVCAIPMWGAYDVARIQEICSSRNLILVEDAAQCLGGTYRGKALGKHGVIGSFSLDFGKTLSAGEAGFVVTDDEEIYRRASEYSDHGHVHDPSVPRGQDGVRLPGFNYRISELTGAVALGQLERLDDVLNRQRSRSAKLKQSLSEVPGLTVRRSSDPEGEPGDTIIVQLETEALASATAGRLLEKGIGSKILPEALSWHFAGAWDHIWSAIDGGAPARAAEGWPRTRNLLYRSVALGISVNEDSKWDDTVVGTFRTILEES